MRRVAGVGARRATGSLAADLLPNSIGAQYETTAARLFGRVLAVIVFLEARWPADEIADRVRRQGELGEEPDGGADRDHVGEVLLGVGGDQYHW